MAQCLMDGEALLVMPAAQRVQRDDPRLLNPNPEEGLTGLLGSLRVPQGLGCSRLCGYMSEPWRSSRPKPRTPFGPLSAATYGSGLPAALGLAIQHPEASGLFEPTFCFGMVYP